MNEFCPTPVFMEQVASLFHLILQQVSKISESEWEKAYKCLVLPKVRVTIYPDKAKSMVVWKFGKTIRYRHLTIQQIKNLINKPFSIMRKVAQSIKGVGL